MPDIAPHPYHFNTGGLATILPAGPRGGFFGTSDQSAEKLRARITALEAGLNASQAATRAAEARAIAAENQIAAKRGAQASAPAPSQNNEPEIDAGKIFENRAKAIEAARTNTTKTQAATDEIDAAAIFQARK
jgi:hypothetical protein